MKKILVYMLVLAMMVSMMACGNTTGNQGSEQDSETESQTETTTETESATETESETVTEVPTETETVTETETETETETPTEPDTPAIVQKFPDVLGYIRPTEFKTHGRDVITYGDRKLDPALVEELETLLDGYGRNIGIAAWRVDSSLGLSYNTQQGFFSACTIKTGYMLYVCRQIEAGLEDPNTKLTYQSRHYHGGSGKIKYAKVGTQYTIKYLIEQAMCISDNVAYNMLVEHFGKDGYHQMIKDMQCESLNMKGVWGYNVVADDMIVVWDAVYKYFQTETEMAQLFYNSCLNTPFNYGTETLCEYVDYSHKSGDNFGTYMSYHDAGIIWDEECPYIFSVFTKSEGTRVDVKTVDRAMELVYQIMTGKVPGAEENLEAQ